VTLLLDTSVWVEHLRDTGSPACQEVVRLLEESPYHIVTTPLVVMELLAGARSEQGLRSLEQLSAGLPILAVDDALDLHAAAAVHRAARREGRTVRGLIDCLHVVVAERHGATLVHRDPDLAVLGRMLPALRTVDLRRAG
jgi:predicted nucleic acid-binding protein